MKKKDIRENKIVKWILLLALIFGAVVYGAQSTVYHTIGAILMGGLAIKFFIDHIMNRKK